MAKVYIAEYADIRAAAAFEPGTDQTPITTSGTSAQSAVFAAATRFVRLHVDAGGPISFVFGANPTATTDSRRMAAGQTEYFYVYPGHRVALITNT